ncbi:MAG: arylesterase [Candidatus Latescibacteria bacterium]|nr:arylesterase [Candidatus Latescibacterota bacterium]
MGFYLGVVVHAEEGARKTVLFFGDSLTAGYGLDEERAFPAVVQAKIDSVGMPFEVVNAGLSGETSSGGLRRIGWLMRRKIDVLVLALGANDALRGVPLEVTRESLQGIVDKVKEKYKDVKIVVVGMEAPPNLGDEYTKGFREIFKALAERNDAVWIPFLLAGVAGNPELNLPDRIHPTEEGHQILAENVWRVLELVLKTF